MDKNIKPKFIRYIKAAELFLIGIIVFEIIGISLINPGLVNLYVNNHIISYFTLYIVSLILLTIFLTQIVINLTLFKSIDKAFLSRNFKIFIGIFSILSGTYLLGSLSSQHANLGFLGYYTILGPNSILWFALTIMGTSLFVNNYRNKSIGHKINTMMFYLLNATLVTILGITILDAVRLDNFTMLKLKHSFSLDIHFIMLIVMVGFIYAFYRIFNTKKDIEKYVGVTTILVASILFTIFSYQIMLFIFLLTFSGAIFIFRKNSKQRNILITFTVAITVIQFLSMFMPINVFKTASYDLPFSESINVTIEALQRQPLLGAGANSFLNSFWQYRSQDLNLSDLYNKSFSKPSTEVLLLIHDTGIIGLIFMILIGFFLIKIVFTTHKGDALNKPNIYLLLTYTLGVLFFFTTTTLLGYLFLALATSLFLSTADDYYKRQNIVNFSTNTIVETIPPEKNINNGISIILNSILIILIFITLIILSTQFTYALQYISNEVGINYTRYKFKAPNIDTKTLTNIVNKQREIILDANNVGKRGDYPNEYALMNISIAKLIINNNPKGTQALSNLGPLITTLIESSIAGTNKAVELYPNSVDEWKTRGTIYATMADFRGNSLDIAIASYIKAAQLSPNDPTIRLELGKLYILNLKNKDAIEQLSKSIRLKKDLIEARALLIQLYYKENKLIDGLDHIRYFIENVSTDNKYYQNVADIISKYKKRTQSTNK